jgi:hypothetical protein
MEEHETRLWRTFIMAMAVVVIAITFAITAYNIVSVVYCGNYFPTTTIVSPKR